MNKDHPDLVLKSFPGTCYFPEWQLVTWHPRGVFDDTMADQAVAFIEMEERIQAAPFHRYTNLSGLTHVQLEAGHVFQIAKRRHRAIQHVKSAFFTDKVVTLSVAYLYETLMASATVKVRVFRKRDVAAEWLGVPIEILSPPEGVDRNKKALKK
jgi:hypothetical protein